MNKSVLASITCLTALSGVTSSASAATTTIPPVEWGQGVSEVLTWNGTGYEWVSNPVTGPGTVKTSAPGGTSAVSATLTPSPSLSAAASVFATNFYPDARSSLILKYYIEIVGPNGLAPLTVQASGWADTVGPNTGSYASLTLSIPANPVFVAASQSGRAEQGFSESFSVDTSFATPTNTPFAVQMTVNAIAQTYTQLGVKNSASAYVDPVFSVPDGYTLLFSEGVGNEAFSAPSPSPGSGLLGLVFFVIVGTLAKARGVFAE